MAVVRLDSGDMCQVAPAGLRAGQPVQMSVRPESITIDSAPVGDGAADGAADAAALRASVEQVAYLGAAVQYQIRTDGGLALSVLAGKAGHRFESGDRVRLAWLPAEALVIGDRSVDMEDES